MSGPDRDTNRKAIAVHAKHDRVTLVFGYDWEQCLNYAESQGWKLDASWIFCHSLEQLVKYTVNQLDAKSKKHMVFLKNWRRNKERDFILIVEGYEKQEQQTHQRDSIMN